MADTDDAAMLLQKIKMQSPDAYRHILGLLKSLARSQEPPIPITQARRLDLPAIKATEE